MRVTAAWTGLAILAAALAADGCGGAGDRPPPPLGSGPYSIGATAETVDECWPSSADVPAIYLAAGAFTVSVEPDGGLSVAAPELLRPYVPDLVGLVFEGDVLASGARLAVASTACWLAIDVALDAEVIAPDRFEGALAGRYSATGLLNSMGLPSDCSALQGGFLFDVAFPAIDDPAGGSCSLLLEVEGARVAAP